MSELFQTIELLRRAPLHVDARGALRIENWPEAGVSAGPLDRQRTTLLRAYVGRWARRDPSAAALRDAARVVAARDPSPETALRIWLSVRTEPFIMNEILDAIGWERSRRNASKAGQLILGTGEWCVRQARLPLVGRTRVYLRK